MSSYIDNLSTPVTDEASYQYKLQKIIIQFQGSIPLSLFANIDIQH